MVEERPSWRRRLSVEAEETIISDRSPRSNRFSTQVWSRSASCLLVPPDGVSGVDLRRVVGSGDSNHRHENAVDLGTDAISGMFLPNRFDVGQGHHRGSVLRGSFGGGQAALRHRRLGHRQPADEVTVSHQLGHRKLKVGAKIESGVATEVGSAAGKRGRALSAPTW